MDYPEQQVFRMHVAVELLNAMFKFIKTKPFAVPINTTNLTCHCTGAAMSPAGAAVLRDVLVTSCTGVVDAVYVPPVPGLWQLSEVQKFMWTSCSSERDRQL